MKVFGMEIVEQKDFPRNIFALVNRQTWQTVLSREPAPHESPKIEAALSEIFLGENPS